MLGKIQFMALAVLAGLLPLPAWAGCGSGHLFDQYQFAFIGPGLSYNLGRDTQLYGFVQVPVYQYVNGVQLTADWSLVAGLATRF